ncbi:MAG: class II glutamine amidotransferase [Bacillota bacterium]|nr:class II glutamine amidotransferase [Bacillota bacterium]
MCELFGVNSKNKVTINDYLKTFMSHSTKHPNGWGIAQFWGTIVNLEKEPKAAINSDYLSSRLEETIETENLIAHIRLATRGKMTYNNCHPFVKRDRSGRAWTLAHNGTIFKSEILDTYKEIEKGGTDSERILCHVIHEMDKKIEELGRDLSSEERLIIMDALIQEITESNKVNLLIYDGELLYVHTNMKGTLYYKREKDTVYFATVPLDQDLWEPVPMMQLLAFREGKQIFIGKEHAYEYFQEDFTPIYDWANL